MKKPTHAIDEIEDHLASIALLLKPGVVMTFIARTPGAPKRDMIITNDSPDEIIALVQRRNWRKKGDNNET